MSKNNRKITCSAGHWSWTCFLSVIFLLGRRYSKYEMKLWLSLIIISSKFGQLLRTVIHDFFLTNNRCKVQDIGQQHPRIRSDYVFLDVLSIWDLSLNKWCELCIEKKNSSHCSAYFTHLSCEQISCRWRRSWSCHINSVNMGFLFHAFNVFFVQLDVTDRWWPNDLLHCYRFY